MRRLVVFALLGVALAGCPAPKHVKAPTEAVINRGTFAYQKVNDGEFIVSAIDQVAFHQALAEIGCGTKYVCIPEKAGDLWSVELHAK